MGYVAEPPCNCILSSCLLVKFTIDAWLASLHHLLPDFDRSHTVPVPASGAGNRCQVSGFDKADDLHHLATLAPMAPGITKSHAFLGILSCAFWTPSISLRFLDFETSEFSCSWGFFGARLPVPDPVPQCHVPRKPFATTHLHR